MARMTKKKHELFLDHRQSMSCMALDRTGRMGPGFEFRLREMHASMLCNKLTKSHSESATAP